MFWFCRQDILKILKFVHQAMVFVSCISSVGGPNTRRFRIQQKQKENRWGSFLAGWSFQTSASSNKHKLKEQTSLLRFIVISMEGETVGVDEVATQCSWAAIPFLQQTYIMTLWFDRVAANVSTHLQDFNKAPVGMSLSTSSVLLLDATCSSVYNWNKLKWFWRTKHARLEQNVADSLEKEKYGIEIAGFAFTSRNHPDMSLRIRLRCEHVQRHSGGLLRKTKRRQ